MKEHSFGFVEGQNADFDVAAALRNKDALETLLGCCRMIGARYRVTKCKGAPEKWDCHLTLPNRHGEPYHCANHGMESPEIAVSHAIATLTRFLLSQIRNTHTT